jgi:hypothetical protein
MGRLIASGRAWWEIAFWVLIALAAISSFIDWLTGSGPPRPQEGQPCGPGYVWKNIAGPGDFDLSCERER